MDTLVIIVLIFFGRSIRFKEAVCSAEELFSVELHESITKMASLMIKQYQDVLCFNASCILI